jgi:putative phosphoesterase
VISDTHGYLDPQIEELFGAVDCIVHAGDIGSMAVLEGLRAIAPVLAVRGNVDASVPELRDLPDRVDADLDGTTIQIVHWLQDAAPQAGTRVVICGHSHKPMNEWRDHILYVNPGAAGRQGFHRERTACLLELGVSPASRLLYLGPKSSRSGARGRSDV